MGITYVKRRDVHTADTRTDEQRAALGALRAAGIRLDRARRELEEAQATNRDRMRKPVAVPWGAFFDAVTGEQRANARVIAAFDVR
jgi:hypothetical protein